MKIIKVSLLLIFLVCITVQCTQKAISNKTNEVSSKNVKVEDSELDEVPTFGRQRVEPISLDSFKNNDYVLIDEEEEEHVEMPMFGRMRVGPDEYTKGQPRGPLGPKTAISEDIVHQTNVELVENKDEISPKEVPNFGRRRGPQKYDINDGPQGPKPLVSENNEHNKEKVYNLEKVDHKPLFPGCETMEGTNQEKEKCTQKEMLNFIYSRVEYSEEDRENCITGTVVIRFVIDENGTIINSEILRDIGGSCGKTSLEAVRAMNQMPKKWTPAMHKGKPVKVKWNLPIRFRVEC